MKSSRFNIDTSMPGALTYREGNTEYRFPVFQENGETVFVSEPTYERLFLFFFCGGWSIVPTLLESEDRNRITARVVEYLRTNGAQVRVMSRDCEEANCQFRPELFDARNRASEALETAGIIFLQDYGSIDPLHDIYGLEVCGIADECKVEPIAKTMQAAFPHWHFGKDYYEQFGREHGWRFAIYMFSSCRSAGCT
jgi:hypothetical protein